MNTFATGQLNTDQLAVLDQHSRDPLLEAYFTAQGANLLTHVFHHACQTERTDVRLADVEDLFRRAGLDEFVQHFATQELGILDLAVELAIGKRPRTAFAELHVDRQSTRLNSSH